MRTFVLVVVGVVALGLTLRFTLNKKPAPDKPTQPGTTQPRPAEPTPEVAPTPVEPTPAPVPTAPEPPRIAGSVQISDASASHFATAPGVIYYCEQHDMYRERKDGERERERIGDCDLSHDLVADANGLHYSANDKIMRITAGTSESHVVAEMEAIVQAIDATYVYFSRPAFDGIENPGVYRVERAGGTPERIHHGGREQFGVFADDEAIWITGYFGGHVLKFARGAPKAPRWMVTKQKTLEDFGVDAQYMYWFVEDAAEIRRRKKAGGAIEVFAKNAMYPLQVVDNHVYWFERTGATAQLKHLPPNVLDAEVLASELRMPTMRADSEGVYVRELDRPGIFMFRR